MMAIILLLVILAVVVLVVNFGKGKINRNRHSDYRKDENLISDILLRQIKSRRDYYRDIYLKSDEWKRKRYVVLKRDNWRCVYCGASATQVHHKKYAKKNIGKEPIEWLVSVCKPCHDSKHFLR
jgi:hypothetical protein